MKIYTIKVCAECPEYRKTPYPTTGGYCFRMSEGSSDYFYVHKEQKPPPDCPLKDYRGER